jgi:hypothetical protein
LRSFRSDVQLRANERTAAFVAEYTLKAAAPLNELMEALRMIAPPSGINGSAFWTEKRRPFTLVSKMPSKCSSVIDPRGARAAMPALAKTISSERYAKHILCRENWRVILESWDSTRKKIWHGGVVLYRSR